MRFERPLVPAAVILVLSGALFACSPNNQGINSGVGAAGGSVGQGGSGGATGNGGTTASGGTTSLGGTTGTGGTTASGGSSGSGGTSATGGATLSGGNSGSGGTAGRGGSGGAAGGNGGAAGSGGATGSGGTAGNAAGSGGAAVNGGTLGSGGATSSGGTAARGGTVGSGGSAGGGGATGSGGSSATGGTTTSLDCTDTSTTALSFTKQYQDGSIAVTGSTKTYYTMTNWWHKFSGQTVKLDGLSMTLGNSQGASVPSTDGNPMGFPTMFIGSYQNHTTVGSNLPMQVSAIKSAPTIFSTNASTLDTSNFNAAYDVWFTATNAKLGSMASSPGKGGAYLMVWLYKPADRQPRGGSGSATGASPNHAAKTISDVPGTWDVWVDNTDPPCISYVSSTPLDSLSYDLNNFIKDSVTNSYGVTSSMFLSVVFAGFEVWSGGDGLQAKQFCAAVN